MISINIGGQIHEFKEGIIIEDIVKKLYPDNKIIVAAVVDNELYNLNNRLEKNCSLEFLTINDEIGNRIYRRSLFLVMAKAIYDLFPEGILSIEHSLSNGIYCELHKDSPLTQKSLSKIQKGMKELIKRKIPIKKVYFKKDELINVFLKQGFSERVELIKQMDTVGSNIYELDGYYNYFFYNMIPHTGYLDRFELHYRLPGFILLYPQRGNPLHVPDFIEQPKLANIFHEYEKWGQIIGVQNVSDLNKVIEEKKYGDLIRVSEALHEKKIANIADQISQDIEQKRVILIAGPSSSGKTTFAQRLAIHLRVNGLKPVAISTDDYFINREDTPKDENGNYDFESIEAIDLELFNKQLLELIQGKEVELPIYNFTTGRRESSGKKMKIEERQPIIIEGIHSLNDSLTEFIPQDVKYKIYISALTQLNIDQHNRIPTTDTRIIRRIVRDHKFRNQTAAMTINWWPGVRRGEERNIFPYQENADLMFNSALVYELPVLKKYAKPLLEEITADDKSYYQARRLLGILKCFKTMPEGDIPDTSIIKEFIGGSPFN
nr:nucleoside kinase [Iocasia fonsfrigidae]